MEQLGPETSVSDIAQWCPDPEQRFALSVTKKASFAPCVEAVCLAKLADFLDNGVRIETKFEGIRVDCSDADAVFRTGPPVLSGLFGLHLAYLAASLVDESARNIREELLTALWTEVGRRGDLARNKFRKMAGTLLGRQKVSIVCRDPDSPIPDCLRETEATKRPTGEKFRAAYLRLVSDAAEQNSFRLPAANSELITFLYESFANAYEHGRARKHKTSQPLVRGILFERITLAKSERGEFRRDLQGPLRDYVVRMRNAEDPASGFLAVTVADLGVGIHNTLPAVPDENAWARLNRAFRSGESSKPIGTDIQRGKGLDDILGACESLRSLLLVFSGGEFGFFDGAVAKRSESHLLQRCSDWESAKSCGTSLTIVFPSFSEPSPLSQPTEQQVMLLP